MEIALSYLMLNIADVLYIQFNIYILVECEQVPAYNRHTLPGETGTEEQAKEILILRHRSLRLQMNKSDLAHSGKEVMRGQKTF